MPRGKYVNHKGRCRQFTPSDQLQKELGMIMEKEQVPDQDQGNDEPINQLEQNSVSSTHNLIKVSNPNRLPLENQEMDKSKNYRCREERKQKQVPRNSQAQADLARLSIVRKEREAAAERRLAAKKAAAEADALKMVSGLKKIPLGK